MMVDDEPKTLDVIKAMVESLGCTVVAMTDSREAAKRLADEKFDGVFLDVNMPHPDGIELAKLVRSSPLNKSVPIVMFTGSDDVATMRQGFKAGATCFLGKPVSIERVSRLVSAMRGSMRTGQRRSARLPYSTAVDCRAGNRHLRSSSLSLSEDGILLGASGGLEMGQQLDLEFMLPHGSARIKVRGKVVYKQPPDSIGVEFLDLSKPDREAIQKYLTGSVTE
jgi:CheY-like chemotaxis protein